MDATSETNDLVSLEIKMAYRALISEYVYLLRLAASNGGNWIAGRLIEDHVRANLREIIKAFTLLEHYSLDLSVNEDSSWLRQETEYLTRLADQLADLRQPVLAYAWRGLTLLFGSAVLEYAGPTGQTQNVNFLLHNVIGIVQTLLFTFGVILLLLSFVLMAAGTVLVNVKRFYLKPGYDEYDLPRGTTSPTAEEVNVYELENELYKLLNRKKPQEPLWDVWGLGLSGTLLAAMLVGLTVWLASIAPDQYVIWTWVIGLLMSAMLITLFIQEIRSRLRRDR